MHSGNGCPSASVVKGHSIVEHTSVQVNVGQQRGDWLENGKCERNVVMAMSAIGRNSHTVSAIRLLYCGSTIPARFITIDPFEKYHTFAEICGL